MKHFIFSLSIIICLFFFGITVNASDVESNFKYITSGSFDCNLINSSNTENRHYDFSCPDGSYLFFIRYTNNVGYDSIGYFSSSDIPFTYCIKYLYDNPSDNSTSEGSSVLGRNTFSSSIADANLIFCESLDKVDFVSCTFPIFTVSENEDLSKNDAIQNYLSNGDYSGASNKDYIDNILASDDGTVEIPKNLKVIGGYATGLSSAYSLDKDCVLQWIQSVDTTNYCYDMDAMVTIGIVSKSGSASLTGESYSSDWVPVCSGTGYGSAKDITRRISADFLNDSLLENCFEKFVGSTGSKLPYKGYMISSLKIRIRNRVSDKCSDYVVVNINFDGATTTATVEDENGNTVESEDYNGNDVSGGDDKIDTSNISIDGLMGYIKSGFGLLGSGGIIALMSGTFSYLPGSIWTIIKFYISMLVAIAIIAAVKEMIF